MRIDGMQKQFSQLIASADRKGKLPPGMFKELAVEELETSIDQMQANFTAVGVQSDKIFTMIFSKQFDQPCFDDANVWVLPALRVENDKGEEVRISGIIKQVSHAGLLHHQTNDFKNLIKIWPQLLILQCAIQQFNLPIVSQAISARVNKPIAINFKDPHLRLASYISYYQQGLQAPSFLLPEWVEPIIEGNAQALGKLMQNAIDDPFASFYNEYALWLFRDIQSLPMPQILLENWGKIARQQFEDLLRN